VDRDRLVMEKIHRPAVGGQGEIHVVDCIPREQARWTVSLESTVEWIVWPKRTTHVVEYIAREQYMEWIVAIEGNT
jgi:hypothetical protein